MYDVIIIGSGPAGISASIYLKRASANVIIISTGESTITQAKKIENYYGFDSISGSDLYEKSIKQIDKLGITHILEEVVSIDKEDVFEVTTNKNKYKSKVVVLATGQKRKELKLKNLDALKGHGISTCAVCDGFFYKNKKIGLLGTGEYAIHELNYLKNITEDIVIFSNGKEYLEDIEGFKVYNEPIKEILGEEKLLGVKLNNNEEIILDGLFIAVGIASANDFASTLGILTENNNIKVNDQYETNIEGLYAIGDLVSPLKQIAVSVSDGAKVSSNIMKYLKGGYYDKKS